MQDQLPSPVRWARILVFVIAGLTFAMSAVSLLQEGLAAQAFGNVLFAGASGVAQLLLGLLIPRKGAAVLTAVIVVQSFFIAYTLFSLNQNGSLSQLVLPGAVIALVLNRTSRDYFLRS